MDTWDKIAIILRRSLMKYAVCTYVKEVICMKVIYD